MIWLARHQRADGGWGNPQSHPAVRTRLTGMAMISFIAYGYSHLSRDVYDSYTVGDVMRRGFHYLMARQDDKGSLTPGDNNLDAHLWGTLVFTEYYGNLFSIYGECAKKATAYVESLQRPDGGWGTGEAPNPMTTLLALLVIESARYMGLKVSDATIRGADNALASLAERDAEKAFDPVTTAALLAVVSLWRSGREARYRPLATAWAARTALALEHATASEVHLIHWGSMAFAHYDGPCCHKSREERPAEERWNGWSGKLKTLMHDFLRTEAHEDARGSRDATRPMGQGPAALDDVQVEATCLNSLNLALFFAWSPTPDMKYRKGRRIWTESFEPW